MTMPTAVSLSLTNDIPGPLSPTDILESGYPQSRCPSKAGISPAGGMIAVSIYVRSGVSSNVMRSGPSSLGVLLQYAASTVTG